jgi:hypothetical protein
MLREPDQRLPADARVVASLEAGAEARDEHPAIGDLGLCPDEERAAAGRRRQLLREQRVEDVACSGELARVGEVRGRLGEPRPALVCVGSDAGDPDRQLCGGLQRAACGRGVRRVGDHGGGLGVCLVACESGVPSALLDRVDETREPSVQLAPARRRDPVVDGGREQRMAEGDSTVG